MVEKEPEHTPITRYDDSQPTVCVLGVQLREHRCRSIDAARKQQFTYALPKRIVASAEVNGQLLYLLP